MAPVPPVKSRKSRPEATIREFSELEGAFLAPGIDLAIGQEWEGHDGTISVTFEVTLSQAGR